MVSVFALVLALALPAAPFAGTLHPESLSRSRLVVAGRSASLSLRFQTLSAIEALPELDLDRDGRLTQSELDSGFGPLAAYLLERWRLFEATASEETSEAVPAQVIAMAVSPSAFEGPASFQWMEATIEFECARELRKFTVESRLFHERDPFHRDYLSLFWNDDPEVHVFFESGKEHYGFEPGSVRRPGVVRSFFGLGFRHILEGYDHLAFLLMLLVAAPRFRSLVGVVTAFTIAHSITLVLAVRNPGGMLDRIPDPFVELAIALSIAYVAAENLMRKESRSAWIEAFVFGLLHGLGFAGFLGDALAGESLAYTALFGFNVGVEAGQLVVMSAVGALFFLGSRTRTPRSNENAEAKAPALVPRAVVVPTSALVCVISLYWFAQRAGWVG